MKFSGSPTRSPRFRSRTVLSLMTALMVAGCDPTTSESTNPEDAQTDPAQVTAPVAAQVAAPAPAAPVISDDPVIQKLVQMGLFDSQVADHLRVLTKDIGPRLTSSHGLMKAEQWAVQRFVSFGLKSHLEEWGTFPVGFDRGPAWGKMVAPTTVSLDFTTPSWTPGVMGPVRGHAVLFPSDTKAVKKDVAQYKGAWVVEPRRPRGEDKKILAKRKKTIEALREAGIAGFVRPDRNKKGELVHTFGSKSISWDNLPQDVSVMLRSDQHRDLTQRVEQKQAVELEFSIDNRFFRGPVPLFNVIADIPGTEKPDEYVIVSGHLDSWDGAEGAVDNGTGVSTAMEAARLIMATGARPKRTIRFILWSGEEQGLYGSAAYVKAHPELLPKISAVFVHDGGTNYLSGLKITPEMQPQMQSLLGPLAKLNPDKKFGLELTDILRGGGSDHTPFIQAGVPGFFWNQAGKSEYNCMHHTQWDTFETAIDDYQRHSSVIQAVTAWQFANAPTLLDRKNAFPNYTRDIDARHDWAQIIEVNKGGKAQKSGLRKGDKILSVEGSATNTSSRVRQLLNRGEPIKKLEVKRGKKTFSITLDFTNDAGEIEFRKIQQERLNTLGKEVFDKIYAEPIDNNGGPQGGEPNCSHVKQAAEANVAN